MNQESFKKAGLVIALVIFLVIFALVWQSLADLKTAGRTAGLETARAAVSQAVMQCYALEGAYPPGLRYLQEHYGLILDESRYAFYYEVIGDNVYPIVDVQLLEEISR